MAILTLYWILSALCWAYVLRFGESTGRWAFVLFVCAMLGTYMATSFKGGRELWTGANMPLLITDAAYFVGLYALALNSRKHWPIWSAGLQLMCMLTHFGPLVDRYSQPGLYRALESFWMVPMLITMVLGIAKDRRSSLYGTFLNGTAARH